MAQFEYQGQNKNGQKVTGKLDARDDGEARMTLRAMGIRPTRISKVGVLNADLGALVGGAQGAQGRVPLNVLSTFTRQLHVLITSGIPIVQAMDALGEQATDKTMKAILINIKEKVSTGTFFWEALSHYPKAFPRIYVALVRAGEASGAMDSLLKRLSRYLEDSERIQKLLKSAMMYPMIVIVISIGVISAMLTFVIPKFAEMLTGSGQELPAPTQFVINLSNFLVAYWYVIFPGMAMIAVALRQFSQSEGGRAQIQRGLFRAPLFGQLMQKGAVARFARTMSTLLAAGVNLMDAIDICKATVDNVVMEESVAKIRSELEQGKTLASIVSRMDVFPKMAVQMISVGESTGNIDKMLDKVADYYEAEVETLVNGLTKLIEPILLVFLGGTVGGLLIAMYLPIFKLAGGAE